MKKAMILCLSLILILCTASGISMIAYAVDTESYEKTYTDVSDEYDFTEPAYTLPPMMEIRDSGTCGDNVTWEYYFCDSDWYPAFPDGVNMQIAGSDSYYCQGKLTISGTGDMYADYYDVQQYPWYKYRDHIQEVIINDGVTNVCQNAFYGYKKLKDITISDSIKHIGKNAFNDTAYYNNSANWNGDVLYIDNYLIKAKDTIANEYEIVDGTIVVSENAFKNCSNLSKILIPESLKNIGMYAFDNCINIDEVHIKSIENWCNINFENSGANPLSYAHKLYLNDALVTSVVIPDSVTSIGKYAFYNCTDLQSVIIPDSVINIGCSAFEECSDLSELTIGNSVTNIGESTFKNCKELKEIVIPDSVKEVGYDAFAVCTNVTRVVIGDGLTYMEGFHFYGCENLTSVTIGDSVKYIHDSMFMNCSNLENITFGNSITSIGGNSFKNCSKLTFISIPDSVALIGYGAFSDCQSLKKIEFGDNVKKIESKAFLNCTSLDEVHIKSIENWCNINFENSGANPLSYAHKLYLNDALVTSVVIPDSVTSIGKYAFYNCTDLQSVIIPDSVINIGCSAFESCSNLSDLSIGSCVTNIEENAFYNCCSLSELTIGKNVKSIGNSAFNGCTGIVNVIIPNNVESVGEFSFWNCGNLESITFKNPDCMIYDDYKTISGSATIYGYKNSTAQQYAGNYNRKFKVIEDKEQLGDVNGDGIISILDATNIQKQLVGLYDFTNEQRRNADVNGDGVINVLDATHIQKYLVGLVEI